MRTDSLFDDLPAKVAKTPRKLRKLAEARLSLNHHMRLRDGSGEVWHFALNIPHDVRDHFQKPHYISHSLDTADVLEARKRRDKALVEWELRFDKVRDAGQNHHMRRSDGKSGNWTFQLWIPDDLRSHFDTKTINTNLGTKDVFAARTKRDTLLAEWKQRFADLRNGKPSPSVAPVTAPVVSDEGGDNAYLRCSPRGAWFFQISIPDDLRERLGKTTHKVNLATSNVENARRKRDGLLVEWRQRFIDLRAETKASVQPVPSVVEDDGLSAFLEALEKSIGSRDDNVMVGQYLIRLGAALCGVRKPTANA